MKIYILEAATNLAEFGRAFGDTWVIGYFTNKKALLKAVLAHTNDLGLYSADEYKRDFATFQPEELNFYLYTGRVFTVPANVGVNFKGEYD